jgi:aryl-alcohol dehydrogenase-like predicted oxidoreductase
MMESRRLGPVVGLGTWNTFGGDVERAHLVVDAALDAGVEVFDSSPMYRGAEASLGAALGGRGTVATKIWAPSVEEGREQYRRQLGWFGRVAIEQIHNLVAWEQQLEWLEEERASGRIDKLGVTHYASGAFEKMADALRTGRFDTVQLPYNPHEREVEEELLPLAAELGVAVIVMRPFAEGELVRRDVDPGALRELGVETWPQALLKWVLSDERVDLAIPATRRPERTAENTRAGEPPWFTPEQRALVEELAA